MASTIQISSTWAIYVKMTKRGIIRPHLKSAASANLPSSTTTKTKINPFMWSKILNLRNHYWQYGIRTSAIKLHTRNEQHRKCDSSLKHHVTHTRLSFKRRQLRTSSTRFWRKNMQIHWNSRAALFARSCNSSAAVARRYTHRRIHETTRVTYLIQLLNDFSIWQRSCNVFFRLEQWHSMAFQISCVELFYWRSYRCFGSMTVLVSAPLWGYT